MANPAKVLEIASIKEFAKTLKILLVILEDTVKVGSGSSTRALDATRNARQSLDRYLPKLQERREELSAELQLSRGKDDQEARLEYQQISAKITYGYKLRSSLGLAEVQLQSALQSVLIYQKLLSDSLRAAVSQLEHIHQTLEVYVGGLGSGYTGSINRKSSLANPAEWVGKSAGFSESLGYLDQMLKHVALEWKDLQVVWSDSTRRFFESHYYVTVQEHLGKLRPQLGDLADGLPRAGRLMSKVEEL